MLLTDVKDYLSGRGRVSLDDLVMHFTVQPEAMRGLVETWISKGRVRRITDRLPCGTCGKCDSATTETYEWVGAILPPPTRPCSDA
jgi:putative ferrous iron transport protein C